MSLKLAVTAVGLAAASGVPGLLVGCHSPWSQRISLALMIAAAVAGLTAAGLGLSAGGVEVAQLNAMPAFGEVTIGMDALGAFFLVPIFLTQHYVLYILVTVVAMLVWTLPIEELLHRIFGQ